jgi:hypothetical protein
MALAAMLLVSGITATGTQAGSMHAPSFAGKTYPAATQAARDWAYAKLGPRQFGCLDRIFHYESGWRVNAGRVDGPFGIPQANPGAKMQSAGKNWRTSPMVQVKWGISYVVGNYGSACNAWSVWQRQGWY